THNDYRSGKATYNFCTPQRSVPFSAGIYTVTNDGVHNAVCGCVATAMSQLMRYHKYPDIPVTNNLTHTCWFDATKIKITMQGGLYDWDMMTLEPSTDPSLTEDNRRAIGKITSDAGISVGMHYTLDDSGSFLSDACAALRDVFHFGQAYYYCLSWDGSAGSTTMFNDTMLNKAVFANFDAGFPVLFGITGDAGGHAIVGDGYGYDGGDAFVHLNFGWSGSADVWYNLPDLGMGHSFDAVNEIVFNALPREKKGAILSGRVYDVYGKPAAGAAVKIYKREPREVVAETNACASGVFAFVLPIAMYDVEIAFSGGLQAAKRIGVSLNPPTDGTQDNVNYTNPDGSPGVMKVNHYVASSANAGNLREEFRLEWADTVRINDPENGDYYASLDAALAASADGDVLYVCHPARLNGTFTLDHSVKIVSTNIYNIVTRARDAQLHVAAGGVLKLEKQRFASADETDDTAMIVVDTNGVVQVGSDVRVPQGYRTALHTGFAMADVLTEPVFIQCDEGMDVDDRVGVVLPDVTDATSVNRVLHPFDDEIGGVVKEEGDERFIVWSDLASVDPRDAVASVNGLYRRSLNAVLRHLSATDDSTVLVYTNCTLTATNVVVARNVSIASSDAKQRTVAVAPEAFFEVKEGGALTIQRITFDGQQARRDTFIKVNGGTVELSTYGRLAGFYGTNMVSGAICAREGGWVKMTGANAKISDCWNLAGFVRGELPVVGGGVTLLGANAELTRGQITKCFAPNGGGGVFADSGSKVYVSGDFSAENNAEGESFSSNYTYSDVCVMDASVLDDSVLCVKGPFTGSVGVCGFYADSFANEKGQTFAVADDALSAADAKLAAVHFFNSRAKREGEDA
ncbi:MAG: C10 family peptidase, partial [Kiritimatiellae bacterium]|nr:C10 family peptidase [Kiritimatiellia bacterium]